MEMGKHSNSQDDEPKRVPPENEADSLRNADQSDSSESNDELGHGTVDDVVEAGHADNDAEHDIDATVVGIEPMDRREESASGKNEENNQGEGTVGDVSDLESADRSNADESNADETDLDATIVGIDPTVGLERKRVER